MRLLDLFCGAGGASVGYYQAGFDSITGVDIRPQPHYPFTFVLGDALEFLLDCGSGFDVIHASPPCQFASGLTPKPYRAGHPNLIPRLRTLLPTLNRPFVIENVPAARRHLVDPLMLCGTMFGLGIWRHRLFEIYPGRLVLTPPCRHIGNPVLISGTTRKDGLRIDNTAQQRREASGLWWMTVAEMDEAIPPAYTRFIGQALLS